MSKERAINLPRPLLAHLGLAWCLFVAFQLDWLRPPLLPFLIFNTDIFIAVLKQELAPWYLTALVGYGYMHASFIHITLNSLWLAAVGTPVLEQLGWFRLTILMWLGSGAGAAAFALNNMYTSPNLVGLSAAVSALFGAFVRLPMPGRTSPLPLLDTKVTRFSIGFLLLHVVLAVIIPPGFENVAWDAHIAGFLIGLLLVPIFLKRP